MADIKHIITERKLTVERQREKRKENRKKHICIIPGCKFKCPPIIIYHQYCPIHHNPGGKSYDN